MLLSINLLKKNVDKTYEYLNIVIILKVVDYGLTFLPVVSALSNCVIYRSRSLSIGSKYMGRRSLSILARSRKTSRNIFYKQLTGVTATLIKVSSSVGFNYRVAFFLWFSRWKNIVSVTCSSLKLQIFSWKFSAENR